MENKNIEMKEPYYLHCDNTDCNHDEPFEGEFRKELIGTPCPKCGSNLLTTQDYEDALLVKARMITAVDFINSLSEEQMQLYSKMLTGEDLADVDEREMSKLSVHIHDGKLNLEIEKENNEQDKNETHDSTSSTTTSTEV